LGIAVIAQHIWLCDVMRHHGIALHLAVHHGKS
jgi:hypothetical protein